MLSEATYLRLSELEEIIESSAGKKDSMRYLSSYIPKDLSAQIRYFCTTHDRGISFLVRFALRMMVKDKEELLRFVYTRSKHEPVYPPRGIFGDNSQRGPDPDDPYAINAYVKDVELDGRYIDLASFVKELAKRCNTSQSYVIQNAIAYFFRKLNEKEGVHNKDR